MEDEVVLYFRSFDTQSVHLASASLVEHGVGIYKKINGTQKTAPILVF